MIKDLEFASPESQGIRSEDILTFMDRLAYRKINMHAFLMARNGKIIAEGKGLTTIDLDDYSDEIRNYVRAEAYGVGGVMYTQPFALDYNGVPRCEVGDFDSFFDWGKFATAICDTPVRALNIIVVLFDLIF